MHRERRQDRYGEVSGELMTWSYILEYIWNDIDPYDQFIMLYCTNYSMYTCYDHVT